MEADRRSTSNQKTDTANVPNYNWKDVTPEFFDSIKGNIYIIYLNPIFLYIWLIVLNYLI